jgi:hypothetical protein
MDGRRKSSASFRSFHGFWQDNCLRISRAIVSEIMLIGNMRNPRFFGGSLGLISDSWVTERPRGLGLGAEAQVTQKLELHPLRSIQKIQTPGPLAAHRQIRGPKAYLLATLFRGMVSEPEGRQCAWVCCLNFPGGMEKGLRLSKPQALWRQWGDVLEQDDEPEGDQDPQDDAQQDQGKEGRKDGQNCPPAIQV